MPGNPVVHFEIGCEDGSRTRDFLSALFDWEITGSEAGLASQTGGDSPISGHIGELASEWGNYVIVYVQVDDLEASLTKAAELGGLGQGGFKVVDLDVDDHVVPPLGGQLPDMPRDG